MLQQHDFKTPGFYKDFVSPISPKLEDKIISNGIELKTFVLENLGADEGSGENKEGSVMLEKKQREPGRV